jgi:parallel beta-helix repeat protein
MMTAWVLAAAVAGVGIAVRAAEAPLVLHVALDGQDTGSGRADDPFATITRARDEVRALKAAGEPAGPITVRVHGGRYFIGETIAFGPQDSGTAQSPITYEAAPGETPVLCGGKRIEGFKPERGEIMVAGLPEVRDAGWIFRRLFVKGVPQIRARYPNVDPTDRYGKGFAYVDKAIGGFGVSVGNIHNVGDWMEYRPTVPADGEYAVWVYYGALNQPFGNTDMGGRTAVWVDDGEPVPLMDLPDTGGWGQFTWSKSAALTLTAGEHVLRWTNLEGGGLNLEAFALSDDPVWQAEGTKLAEPAAGKHVVVIQAEDFLAFNGKQLSVGGSGGSRTEFRYREGDIKPSWLAEPDPEVHIFQSANCRAFKEIVTLAAVDEATRTVTVSGPECTSGLQTGDRYVVENLLEELDSPGEWYLDTVKGRLHYWPQKPLTAQTEVIAPVVKRMIEVSADASKGEKVEHLRFVGLTVEDTDYLPGDGCTGYGMGNQGVIHLMGATSCGVERCRFRNIGRYAVCLDGGEGNRVVGNDVIGSAEGGVLLLNSARNEVNDNHIYDCGLVYKHIGGVVLQGAGASENTIAHNLIHEMSRYGISLKNAGGRNVIECNELYDLNTETYDTGGIEVTQHDKDFRSGSTIRFNLVRDVIGYSSDNGRPVYLSWGIYLDSYAGGYDVHHNITVSNHNGGIMLQGGKDNHVWNNIFVDSERMQGYISNFARNSTGLTLERNIFYWAARNARLFATGPLDETVIRIDNNLYYAAGNEVLLGSGETFAEWQERGFDTHSLIADPGFVNPAAGDYSLKPDSPALTLGFEPIDTSQIGLLTKRKTE